MSADPHAARSPREELLHRIQDPATSSRDLSALVNSLARLNEETHSRSDDPWMHFRKGSLILEPVGTDWPDVSWRLYTRSGTSFEHVLQGPREEVGYLVAALLGLVYTEDEARAVLAEAPAGPEPTPPEPRPRDLAAEHYYRMTGRRKPDAPEPVAEPEPAPMFSDDDYQHLPEGTP